MGFRLETHYKLFFEDEAFIGAEVTMGRMSMREAFEFDRIRFRETEDLDEFEKKCEDLAKLVAEHLISWNLEDKRGRPLPTTAAAILGSQDDLLWSLAAAYIQAVRGVPGPLDRGSENGRPSDPAASIPMEPLPESPSS